MNTRFASASLLASCFALGSLTGCLLPEEVEEGGANANDRSDGGDQGEVLASGVLTVAPTGRYLLAQRDTGSLLVDVEARSAVELEQQFERFVFAHHADLAYALSSTGTLSAIELESRDTAWTFDDPIAGVTLFRLADDDSTLLVAGRGEALLVDPATGTELHRVELPGTPREATFNPARAEVILAGDTSWVNHVPATPLTLVDLEVGTATTIEIPNCVAPLRIVPDGSRALLSPTFCEEDRTSTPDEEWTNPDPISVIDLEAGTMTFLKNLPGFGPVALRQDGSLAVAYLDTERLDPTMFDDPEQIPPADAERYHLMTIDPASLAFELHAIGPALPRFAMTRDGQGLLVDASVSIFRSKIEADASLSIEDGQLRANLDIDVFSESSPFGYFDLETAAFEAFAGAEAPLDRFVQTAAGNVFTLRQQWNGDGQLYEIDVAARATERLDFDLRDIGILPDGETLVFRVRGGLVEVDGLLFAEEDFCFSKDGRSCTFTVTWRSDEPTRRD